MCLPSGLIHVRILVAVLLCLTGCAPSAVERRSSDLAERWLGNVSDYQARVLGDLRVSDDEYELAVSDTALCLNAKGFATGSIREVPDGVRNDFMVLQGDHTDTQMTEVWGSCSNQHLTAVESVYLAQHARVDADAATLADELVECLAENDIPDAPTAMTDFELFQYLRTSEAATGAWFCRERWLLASGKLGATPPD